MKYIKQFENFNYLKKIMDLIHTKDKTNVDMAFEVTKGQNLLDKLLIEIENILNPYLYSAWEYNNKFRKEAVEYHNVLKGIKEYDNSKVGKLMNVIASSSFEIGHDDLEYNFEIKPYHKKEVVIDNILTNYFTDILNESGIKIESVELDNVDIIINDDFSKSNEVLDHLSIWNSEAKLPNELKNIDWLHLTNAVISDLDCNFPSLNRLDMTILYPEHNPREAESMLDTLKGIKAESTKKLDITRFDKRCYQYLNRFPNLTKIVLSEINSDGEFPMEILKMDNLEHIEISMTKLNSLPPELSKMPNLKSILIERTGLGDDDIPKELKESNVDLFTNYDDYEDSEYGWIF